MAEALTQSRFGVGAIDPYQVMRGQGLGSRYFPTLDFRLETDRLVVDDENDGIKTAVLR
jgi:hypothetical protein